MNRVSANFKLNSSQTWCYYEKQAKQEAARTTALVSRADSIVKHDEADISLNSYMLHVVFRGARTVRILSDDTDVFILLVYWCHKANVTCPVQMEKWNGTVLNI